MGGGRLREVAAHEGLTLCLMRSNKSTMIKKIWGGGGEIFLFLFSCKGPLATWCDLQFTCLYYSTQRVRETSTRIET